jgi:acyl-CoA thioester hydrolase
MSSWAVTYHRRIRYSDIDSQGIVFNGNYLSYYDDTITDLFLAAGLKAADMHAVGYDVLTVHAAVDFTATAELFEDLEVGVRIAKFGNTSVTFELESTVGDRVTTRATVIYVIVDAETFEPIKVPQSLVDAMQAIHPEPIPGAA